MYKIVRMYFKGGKRTIARIKRQAQEPAPCQKMSSGRKKKAHGSTAMKRLRDLNKPGG